MEADRGTRYMNPYLAGFLLGLILLATIFITGRGLGASGAMRSAVSTVVETVAPAHAQGSAFYSDYIARHPEGLRSWLVFEMAGVLVGGFLSGLLMKRLKFRNEHGPSIGGRTRLWAALAGGMLFGFGAQFGRGCTSGAALSGMAILSLGGFITMLAIFGSGYLLAWFFRRLWL